MKKFISGFLCGAILFSTIGGFALSYVANPVDFKVMVNGEEFISNPPALEVEGRTYLPLRAIGEALSVPVNWNEELRQAEVGNSAPVADANQFSRNNPAPINTVVNYTNQEKYSDNYSVALRIMEITRGEDALRILKNENMFNSDPKEGYEYIIVKIAASFLNVVGDGAISISDWDFETYSESNEQYEKVYVVTPNELKGSHYAGANIEGNIVVQVRKNDLKPKLAYKLNYKGEGNTWFKLYE